jgi:carboxymethylenebutenolidase
MIVRDRVLDLQTPTGLMRSYVYAPHDPRRPDAKRPGVVLYSEIFQQTPPIRRLAMRLCGRGFVVVVPEVFHEHEPAGTVLGYDDVGKDKGNRYKYETKLSSYDADARAALDALKALPECDGRLGTMGVCLGGHLAFRAALNADVSAAACFYPTDIHSATLGEGQRDDSLARCAQIKGELLFVFGRQDPHVPFEGRLAVMKALHAAGVCYTWHEFNAEHAFLRDEGARFDPAAGDLCLELAADLFRRALV